MSLLCYFNQGYGLIGGIMLFDLNKMNQFDFSAKMVDFIKKYQLENASWKPKLNDQDIFNAALQDNHHYLKILPCEWNVQYHARINTLRLCLPLQWVKTSKSHKLKELTLQEIPLNCVISELNQIFSCESRAKVIHFMAQSYSKVVDIGFYDDFWDSYAKLYWSLID